MRNRRRWGRWVSEKGHVAEGGQARLYEVLDYSGRYRGEHVLKELKNPKSRERFEREVAFLEQLAGSAYVTPLIEARVHRDGAPERAAYVMPRADRNLEAAARAPGFDIEAAVGLFDNLCRGARDVHAAGLVHRDLKPDNVLLFGGIAKIADLGLGFDEGAERLTDTLEAVGPRFYMAPEHEDGRAEAVGFRADVYSLGKILYFLLTRGRRFAREKHHSRHHSLEATAFDPRARLFEPVLDRSITTEPGDRFANAEVMLRAFLAAQTQYRAHPLTKLLERFPSVDAAIEASPIVLQDLPGPELAFALGHASERDTGVPPVAALRAATAQLEEREVLEAACRCLLRWEPKLAPDIAVAIAGALVRAPNSDHHVSSAVSLQGRWHILELAMRSSSLEVLNHVALVLKDLRAVPIAVERLGEHVEQLSLAARDAFLMSSYELEWPNKEPFLLAHVESFSGSALEAAVAGLCRCETEAALTKVAAVARRHATTGERDNVIKGVIRGVMMRGRGSAVDALRLLVADDTLLIRLLGLHRENEMEQADDVEDAGAEGDE